MGSSINITERVDELSQSVASLQKIFDCPICIDMLKDPVRTTVCGHTFCKGCISQVLKRDGRKPCPLCNSSLSRRSIKEDPKTSRFLQLTLELITAISMDTGVNITEHKKRLISTNEASPNSEEFFTMRQNTTKRKQQCKNDREDFLEIIRSDKPLQVEETEAQCSVAIDVDIPVIHTNEVMNHRGSDIGVAESSHFGQTSHGNSQRGCNVPFFKLGHLSEKKNQPESRFRVPFYKLGPLSRIKRTCNVYIDDEENVIFMDDDDVDEGNFTHPELPGSHAISGVKRKWGEFTSNDDDDDEEEDEDDVEEESEEPITSFCRNKYFMGMNKEVEMPDINTTLQKRKKFSPCTSQFPYDDLSVPSSAQASSSFHHNIPADFNSSLCVNNAADLTGFITSKSVNLSESIIPNSSPITLNNIGGDDLRIPTNINPSFGSLHEDLYESKMTVTQNKPEGGKSVRFNLNSKDDLEKTGCSNDSIGGVYNNSLFAKLVSDIEVNEGAINSNVSGELKVKNNCEGYMPTGNVTGLSSSVLTEILDTQQRDALERECNELKEKIENIEKAKQEQNQTNLKQSEPKAKSAEDFSVKERNGVLAGPYWPGNTSSNQEESSDEEAIPATPQKENGNIKEPLIKPSSSKVKSSITLTESEFIPSSLPESDTTTKNNENTSNTMLTNNGTAVLKRKLSFVYSRITDSQLNELKSFAVWLKANITDNIDDETSHVIIRPVEGNRAPHTFKYLKGIARRLWIVSMDWVLDSLRAKTLLPEENYLVLDSSGEPGPWRCKQASVHLPLSEFVIIPLPPYKNTTSDQLLDLLLLSGAEVIRDITVLGGDLENLSKPRIILTDQTEEDKTLGCYLEKYFAVPLSVEWLFEVLGNYNLVPICPYLCLPIPKDILKCLLIPEQLLLDYSSDSECETEPNQERA